MVHVSKQLAYLITFVVCILLQMAIAPAISIGGARPDFLLIPVLLVSLRSGSGAGGVTGFALGLLYDLIGDGTIGCMALVFTITALVVGLLGSGLSMHSFGALCLLAIASAFFVEIVYAVSVILTSANSAGAWSTIASSSLPSGFYTAVLCCIALVTMGLVIADDQPRMGRGGGPRLGGQIGGRGSRIPRMGSRLK